MKFLILLPALFFSLSIFAQVDENKEIFNELTLEKKREIIIQKLIRDTVKFSKKDIYHTGLGTFNVNSYSPLFVINEKQFFRFDIVGNICVLEFIDQYLNSKNLKSIHKLDRKKSEVLYGINGENGAIILTLRKLKKAKTDNCGFIKSEKRRGSNLDQWKEGDLRNKKSGIRIKEK